MNYGGCEGCPPSVAEYVYILIQRARLYIYIYIHMYFFRVGDPTHEGGT